MRRSFMAVGAAILAAGLGCRSAGRTTGNCSAAQDHVAHVGDDCRAPDICEPARVSKKAGHAVRFVPLGKSSLRVWIPRTPGEPPFSGMTCAPNGECDLPRQGEAVVAAVNPAFVPSPDGSSFEYHLDCGSRGGPDPHIIIVP